ncbi:PDR/VanB family oxidoreductase [Mycolicibacterium sp. CBMA 226]|uniref:PDR/VanB family oxidoreductase n=1 Tax=Mycolicibacterium sp. CBMA 226 TaxID=2606611 RepID=UPI001319742A|nr:PDR/VanB family oxidoreductase [Mycolicibacterium sp. CBMA 226]QGW61372.1 Phenoxybenzoate dioxygenase subunit beta [Mycolicibacterium sp.]
MELIVRERREEADRVISLLLARPDGGILPAWEPGAHVDVVLDEMTTRQYSLSSDPDDERQWRLGILRESESRGGSARIFDAIETGSKVKLSEPRNNFVLKPALEYLFIAGGIGITPILPMIRTAERSGVSWRLLYIGRSRRSMAFLDELASHGDHVTLAPKDEFGRADLAAWLGEGKLGKAVYACGPEALLLAIEHHMSGWPTGSLHVERFRPKVFEGCDDDCEFEVEFVESGVSVMVSPGQTILSAAEESGVPVFASCEEGTCGTCQTPVVEGVVDHRDSILSQEERDRHDLMLICVSRAAAGCSKLRLQA